MWVMRELGEFMSGVSELCVFKWVYECLDGFMSFWMCL